MVWGDRRVRETALARLDDVTDAAALAAKHAINQTIDLADETLAIIDRIVASPHVSDGTKAVADRGAWTDGRIRATRSHTFGRRRNAPCRTARGLPGAGCSRVPRAPSSRRIRHGHGRFGHRSRRRRVLESMPDSLYECCAENVAWLSLRWGRSISPRERRIIDGRFARASVRSDTLAMRYARASINLTHALELHNDSLILAEFPTIIRQAPASIGNIPDYAAQYARLVLAQRLYARGKYADAEKWLLTFRDQEYHPNTVVALWLGKVYEGMGDSKRAAAEYSKAAAWWANADSFLQPRRQEALAGLWRTGGEPDPSTRRRPITAGRARVR